MPSRALAAAGAGRPADTSAADKVFIAGSPVRATAARPRVVDNVNGMANLTRIKIDQGQFELKKGVD